MNKVLRKLPALVREELDAANAENPPFHSLHEGYAVLQEEYEETVEWLQQVQLDLSNLWEGIRKNKTRLAADHAADIANYAQLVAAEAIQVAAMAKKLLNYIDGEAEA